MACTKQGDSVQLFTILWSLPKRKAPTFLQVGNQKALKSKYRLALATPYVVYSTRSIAVWLLTHFISCLPLAWGMR